MQGTVVRVCVVVAAAILNHPLLFPRENTTIPERDDQVIARMREHEEKLLAEKARLEREASQVEQGVQPSPDVEESSSWDLWSALSMIVFLMIEIWRQDYHDTTAQDPTYEEEDSLPLGNVSLKIPLPDKAVLSCFYERCIRISANETWRVQDFVEGFADDLLEALRSVCNRDADMEVEDCIGVGSMYENWRVSKPLICDLIVPFAAPDPYCFTFQLWCNSQNDIPPDRQGYGRIKVVRANEDGPGCVCGKTDLGEDMLCLLHSKNERPKVSDAMDDLLCSKNTPYLAKDQVMKWFLISMTKAWNCISHKYDFELMFRNLDSPGALKVKFRSGKTIIFNITPVVQFEDTDAYFVSHFAFNNDNPSDIFWPLSFAVYEKNLMKVLVKRLPESSCHICCLQIISFLHKKQTSLTGESALTNYHLKTALLHLLLSKPSSDWRAEYLEKRLRDVLRFLEKCLQEKKLYHVLIGNKQVPKHINFPPVFQAAEPLNLFRPLVLQRDLYAKTVEHFQEMLKNAPVLIQEYTPLFPNGSVHSSLNTSF
ncbi:inositol 1,4,5-trisphosphate receptor-interacting protein [Lepisosteus oculatus]|uniref:inositol 1,4,5-trisphosphate receptor-interacting protein n=1 Tax=Lepisosteus oculatus TaxID=7918 RepID=UPI0003EA8E6B|nr:PREDICTED: inositol 1,4,5-trisphosphate receptor-interacting protein [Lepisosteus oculatus]XP_015203107.1 PREDICTED: inositol 1,4,5-trisphosphate receptor-interacting protein [Lepisosteus oculatus]XP_015203108.1 PREDICTED: inositol 1,4,5-trisphosphate receptor-interacting protein [Lepisosteus oculatus]XP_015203109.1 PREDICTED: inositol 1,4,5-trisphosphate receptor-interacting protein [Lepisosteus oculatus]XP_015203110.1 PREDICTED: inositol 1,4,5-trisphosphate receptor-interacting protein [Le